MRPLTAFLTLLGLAEAKLRAKDPALVNALGQEATAARFLMPALAAVALATAACGQEGQPQPPATDACATFEAAVAALPNANTLDDDPQAAFSRLQIALQNYGAKMDNAKAQAKDQALADALARESATAKVLVGTLYGTTGDGPRLRSNYARFRESAGADVRKLCTAASPA